jgi:hypothetical protein
MAQTQKRKSDNKSSRLKAVPPEAAKRRSDADLRPREPARRVGDWHAVRTPAGGTEVGDL